VSQVQGRTSPSYDDFFADDDQPRIWRTTDTETGRPRYHVRTPLGHTGVLSQAHEVDEHEDGTFTVEPKPENSNSILCQEPGSGRPDWHGYVYRNIWHSV
jgi:hypothetical protein